METTQKNREEAAQRRPRQESSENTPKRPRNPERSAAEGAPKHSRNPERSASADAPKRPRNPEKSAPEDAARPRRAASARTAAEDRPRSSGKKPAPARAKASPPQKKRPQSAQQAAKKAAPAKKTPARKPRKQADPEDISNKKRAYGNSKPKKKSALTQMAETVKRSAEKRKKKRYGTGSKAKRPQQPTPAIIYTQPQTFNRHRFVVQMVTVLAVVVAFVLALSVFFKVETITVTGADVYSAWAIREASGIEEGDNLLTFSHARAGAQIMANLPYVEKVRFGIKLPDTVNIIVEEAEVVYAIKDTKGQWWLMSSTGRVVEQVNSGVASNYTQVLGVTLESPAVNLQAVASETAPTETDASGEFIPVTVTGAQQLNTAMQILRALEDNDIVGEAASVDVTRVEDIVLWYGTRYQVNLGDSTRLDYKIACMTDVILQMSDYQSGILDISFTNWPNQVGYTPFS